ncbi:MAG TPA: tetratricopeptide repeat protein [Acetobacteraceae bacterium]|nr:tetratricopeptide repeat protein [Acetobacteraceae bacterium]
MADIFDEVNEELRAERARRLARRYGWLGAAAIAAGLAGVGAWQAWEWRQDQAAIAAGTDFIAAMQAADRGGAHDAALRQFADLAASAPDGYRVLAGFRAAALKFDAGDRAGGLALLDRIATDDSTDKLLRDYATLIAVQRQADDGAPAALHAKLLPLIAPDNPWRPLAEELGALIDLRAGQTGRARDTLRRLAGDVTAPDGVRGRASGLLQSLGDTGAGG